MKYRNNPIYDKTWGDAAFQIMDWVKINFPGSLYHGKVGQIAHIHQNVDKSYKYFVAFQGWGLNAPEIAFKSINLVRPRFRGNPVYPKSWFPGGKFNIGDSVIPSSISPITFDVGVIREIKNDPDNDGELAYKVSFTRYIMRSPLPFSEWLSERHLIKLGTFSENPIYPKRWTHSRFKVGDRVRIAMDDDFLKTSQTYDKYQGRVGRVTHVIPVSSQLSLQRIGAKGCEITVQFPDTSYITLHERWIQPVAWMKENPVYPKSWHWPGRKSGFEVGDVVKVVKTPYKGKYGEIKRFSSDEGGNKLYVVKLGLMTYSFLKDEIRPVKYTVGPPYVENPVYEKTWSDKPYKFKVGDRVRVNAPAIRRWHGEIGTIRDVDRTETVDVYSVYFEVDGLVWNFSGGSLDPVNPTGFTQNPVYDKRWLPEGFKVGTKVRLTCTLDFIPAGGKKDRASIPKGSIGVITKEYTNYRYMQKEYSVQFENNEITHIIDHEIEPIYETNPAYSKGMGE